MKNKKNKVLVPAFLPSLEISLTVENILAQKKPALLRVRVFCKYFKKED